MGLFSDKNTVPNVATTMTATSIAEGTTINGDLTGGDHVVLEGKVCGNVDCRQLTIGKTGELHGEVAADEMLVLGTVVGVIRAKKVTLGQTAKVYGDVDHEELEVEAGALVDGRYTHTVHQRADVGSEKNTDSPAKAKITSRPGAMQKEALPLAGDSQNKIGAAQRQNTNAPEGSGVTKH